MKKRLFIAALSVVLCATLQAQERLDSVVVSVSRAGKDTPVTFTDVSKNTLERATPSSSLPMALEMLPSVVTWNEGGTGLGNSSMTIRGSKGSQINITLNGITLNDAESQEVFWVNIPSLTAIISSVQVQRGLGTSANGAGAFGASLNMNTAFVTQDPWAKASFSGGAFDTYITTFSGSTGLSKSGFYGSAAYSRGSTEGFIRNAWVRSGSAFMVIGWLGRTSSLRLTYLMGDQKSGITWNGLSIDKFPLERTYNDAGEYYDEYGNVFYYPNQSDNYSQHHLQLNYTHAFSGNLFHTTTVNYTRGDGYDEYYKTSRKFKNFGFTALPGDAPSKSDMIYRKKMGNNLWIVNSDIEYRSSKLDVTGGASLSLYSGAHWGEVLWAKALGGKDYDYSSVDWYSNMGDKLDFSVFARGEYRPVERLSAYLDLQYRHIGYSITGKDDDFLEYGAREEDLLSYNRNWNFFNPRVGVSYVLNRGRVYSSLSFGQREPGRADIKENVKGSVTPIVPEKMLDFELGYSFAGKRLEAGVNLYLMEYWDMLLETGRLSNAGYALKENVPRSYRRGVELVAKYRLLDNLSAEGNATFSVNRIEDYTSYVWLEDYSSTVPLHIGRTTMLMSPSVIASGRLLYEPLEDLLLSLDMKYVGKQYLNSTMREELAVPAYYVVNLSAEKTFALGGKKLLTIGGHLNNLFDRTYYASGGCSDVYRTDENGSQVLSSDIWVYPQAPINGTLRIVLSF